jgi:hypothetical protein
LTMKSNRHTFPAQNLLQEKNMLQIDDGKLKWASGYGWRAMLTKLGERGRPGTNTQITSLSGMFVGFQSKCM